MKKNEKEQKPDSSDTNSSQPPKKGFISRLEYFRHLLGLFSTIVKSGFYFFRLGKRPVKASLQLSQKALKTPLPEGWISTFREFVTRNGKWEGHSVRSLEHFMMSPAPGVIDEPRVIGPTTKPVFTSVGFGDLTIKDGTIQCGTAMCEAQDLHPGPGVGQICSALFCVVLQSHPGFDPSGDFWCLSHSIGFCPEIRDPCITYCGGLCPPHYRDPCVEYCGGEGPDDYVPLPDDIQAHWNHPFVQELRAYFGVSSVEKLGRAIAHFMGRNLYDNSAL